MAYRDKITTMRRIAIIVKDHNILWEGVNIEGLCVLRKVSDGYLMIKSEGELDSWLISKNNDRLLDDYSPLIIKYQDKKNDKCWEPRKEGYK